MEARGEIRGGRFVTGFVGEQFARPEALDLLRHLRRSAKTGETARNRTGRSVEPDRHCAARPAYRISDPSASAPARRCSASGRFLTLGYTGIVRWLLFAFTASALFAADPLAASAQKKLDSISESKLKPGSVVVLSPQEINAWLHEKAVKAFPDGLRNEHIELGSGTVDGTALVDLVKIGKEQEQRQLHSSAA